MSKHTKGPWDESRIGAMYRTSGAGYYNALMLEMHGDDKRDRNISRANALLLIAAPELLDALKLCANVLAGHDMSKSALTRALEKAAAAMAKATGADHLKGGE